MGAWGVGAFENDTAGDWAWELEEVEDLSLVQSALADAESAGEYLDADVAQIALAACEVLARLRGNWGYKNPYTESMDKWVESHKFQPPESLLERASAVIDLVLGENSELAELWDEGDGQEWRASVEELRHRVIG